MPDAIGPSGPSKHAFSGRLGKAAEHLIAAGCILASRGRLNVSTALVDDEGVDLVFHQMGKSATLAVQIKSRTSDAKPPKTGQYTAEMRNQTFRPRHDLFVLFAKVDLDQGSLAQAWLIPSLEVAKKIKPNKNQRIVFRASQKASSHDQWSQYRFDRPADLAEQVLKILDGFESLTEKQMYEKVE